MCHGRSIKKVSIVRAWRIKACVLLSSTQYITLTRIALLEGIRAKKKRHAWFFSDAGKMWGSALYRQPAFRKPLSVSMIIILIIQTHSVVDLLIQLVYCLNKLYSSCPFKGFWAIRKPSNNHAVTVMQTRRGQHTHTYIYMQSWEYLFDSTCYPSNHMKNGHQGLSFTKPGKRYYDWKTVATNALLRSAQSHRQNPTVSMKYKLKRRLCSCISKTTWRA